MNKKATFGFRKSKVSKNLCGAILGVMAILTLTANTTFADEVDTKQNTKSVDVIIETPDNSATNFEEMSGDQTDVAKESQEHAGESTGSLPINVTHDDLDQAVKSAEEAGVEVIKEEDVNHDITTTPEEVDKAIVEIKNDYKSQETTIKEKTEEHLKNTDEYNKDKAQYDVDKVQYDEDKIVYDAQKEKHDQEVAKYNADKAQYDTDKATYDAAKAQYDTDKAAYDAAKAQYDTDKATYDAAKAQYDTDKATYDAAKAQYDTDKAAYDAAKAQYDTDKATYDTAKAQYDVAKTQYDLDKAQYDTDKAQYDTDKAAYDAAKTQYDTDKAQYDTDKAAYEAAKAQYDTDKVAYDAAKAQYDTDKVAYDAAKAQYDTDKATYDAAKAQYDTDKAAYDAAKAQYDTDKATYDAAKAQYDTDKAQYDTDKAQYDQDMVAYEAALAEAEAKKNEDGYLSQPLSQTFIFKSEPNATITIDGQVYSSADWKSEAQNQGIDTLPEMNLVIDRYDSYANQYNASRVFLEKDVPLTVTYTDLQNSTFNGKKLSKVEYIYTLSNLTSPGKTKIPAILYKDPTVTINYSDLGSTADINLEAKFYDEDGNPIDMTGGLISFSSLNRDKVGNVDTVEYVRDFNGEYIPISGSSIGVQGTQVSSVPESNEHVSGGSRFEAGQWDSDSSPYKWYGAIVGKAAGETVKLTFGSANRRGIWFAFNSDIKAVGVPIKPTPPVEPTAPTPPVEPTAPTPPGEEPTAPTPPVEPTAPTPPVEPTAPTPPVEPTAPTPPVEPTAPTPPVEPTAPTPPSEEPTAPTPPVEPTAPTPPVEPTAPTPPGEAPTPPTPPVEPKVPVAPVVSYHYHILTNRPPVTKEVKNGKDVDVNNQSVSKQSVIKFELKSPTLPAGRNETTSFVISDPLPKGYEVNMVATKEASPGFTTTYDEAKHIITFTATDETLALLNADLTQSVTPLFPTIVGQVFNDGSTYTNNFVTFINDAYGVRSDIVRVKTPENPRPPKVNKNEKGVVIDGKNVLAGSTNYYEMTWDLDQYKDIQATEDVIQEGFYFVDDYPEVALVPQDDLIRLVDANGQAVTGVSVYRYDSVSVAPDRIKAILGKTNIMPTGAFQLFIADDPQAFFDTYVVTGLNITVINPMKVKDEMGLTGGEYVNKAYQIDFGNGYESNIVTNNIPKISPKKDVTVTNDPADMDNYDGATLQLNQIFNYRLIGGIVPINHSEELFDYSFYDDYDQTGDEYTGQYKTFNNVDILLKDGSVIKAGTDLTEYTESIVDPKDGVVIIKFKEAFLRSISTESSFQAESFIQMKRIAVGTFENTYVNTVNDVMYASNKVRTTTPEPKKPNTPSLPKTGTQDNAYMPLLGFAAMVGAFGIVGMKKKEN
ncbi:SspB-related isopeptide-forming adhesin [Streptococcus zalophi]|uniref:LPXTG cell wall anchor domain-containing protein n=1 Tax=Streptococcus zalophi TaxID=640031 RepID=A0A934UDF5_9STRE|nr:SspB-related isopeptide-forming adhesin [Streptococcus zalophi]MBJ8349623.1 LPXTG cell wall anchor domain-containing protein [Streptococcus zalophi]